MIYISWDIEHNILKLVILGHFLPFYHLKVKILKNEKICWIYHHFPHVYQKSQSYDARFLRYGVRQTEFFVILGHLFVTLPPPPSPQKSKFWKKMKKMPGDIILLYKHVYHKWRSCDISFLKYKVRQTEIFVILGYFLPFQSPDNQENQNIIILHIFTINDNHLIYGSWDMEHDRQNFLSFWTFFCPFIPLWTQKIKIF